MSARSKYVVLFTPPASGTTLPPARSVEGVYAELPVALAYANELATMMRLPVTGFTVEGWRGRQFTGTWNYRGELIEEHERAGEVTTEEEPA